MCIREFSQPEGIPSGTEALWFILLTDLGGLFIMRAYTEKCESENWKKKNEGEWTGKLETGTRNNVLAVGEACVAIFYRRYNYHLDRVHFAVSYSACLLYTSDAADDA